VVDRKLPKPSETWPFPFPGSGRDAISALLSLPPADIFREYDLRGLADAPLDFDATRLNPFVCNRLGRAFGTYLSELDVDEVIVGYDSRAYAPMFADAFTTGLLSTGACVISIGLATTPLVYFAQHELSVAGAVAVTASHNPNGWSGLKLSSAPSTTLAEQEIAHFKEVAERDSFRRGVGTLVEHSVTERYIAFLADRRPASKRIRVAVDGANSISGAIGCSVFERAGYEVIPVNRELDWSFPNHEPDPELVESRLQLAEAVLKSGAMMGVALDGDGDRLGITDHLGATVWSDRVLALLAIDVLERYPGSDIVYDAKCSRLVEDVIEASGGNPVMWKTGHSLIKNKMQQLGAPFAGERSGHFFNAVDYFGFDDGIYAALSLADLVGRRQMTVADLVSQLPHYFSSPTMQAHCADGVKYDVVERAAAVAIETLHPQKVIRVSGARLEFEDGWLLFRASSNVPALVIVCEAVTESRLRELYVATRGVLNQFDEIGKTWTNDPFYTSDNAPR